MFFEKSFIFISAFSRNVTKIEVIFLKKKYIFESPSKAWLSVKYTFSILIQKVSEIHIISDLGIVILEFHKLIPNSVLLKSDYFKISKLWGLVWWVRWNRFWLIKMDLSQVCCLLCQMWEGHDEHDGLWVHNKMSYLTYPRKMLSHCMKAWVQALSVANLTSI